MSTTQQRIYVGGIDPSRGLSVTEVWERLEPKLASAWSDLHQGRCYLQFTVAAAKEGEPPPLTLVKSWFHNVTWKGCKLVVQEARPHFLQRLQDERNSRCCPATGEELTTSTSPPIADTVAPQSILSRHWRIKRGYFGEPVRHVDTQPCDVTSWSMWSRIQKRHLAYQAKMRAASLDSSKRGDRGISLKEAQKQAYYNRSIRFRFTDDDIEGSKAASNTIEEHSSVGSDGASTLQSMKESDSSSDEDKREQYVWSDDDSSESEDSAKALSDDKDGPQIDVADKDVAEAGTSNNNKTYKWSDEESSDDSSYGNGQAFSRVSRDVGEFDSAILDSSTLSSATMPNVCTSNERWDDNTFDLTQDVEMNLHVLSQLFPKISNPATSTPPTPTQTGECSKTTVEQKQAVSSTGWDASGQMLRFDPSLPQSASLLVVEKEPDDSCIETEDRNSPHSNIDAEQEAILMDEPERNEVKGDNVYEQEKLEQVFKEVREATSVVTECGSSFSFGFDLGDAGTMTDASPFTFRANVPEAEPLSVSPSGPTDAKLQSDGFEEVVQLHGSDASDLQNSHSPYRAFDFPSDDILNECVRHFYYDINDGARIINDGNGWRNDPTVKEKWLKERFTLTQDWKRKRKLALARKQKRLKPDR